MCSSAQAAKRMIVAAMALPLSLFAATTHAQDARQWSSGKAVYEKVCGHCHKPEVGVGTQLAGRELPAAYIQAIVRNGFNGMPAFPASFIDDEAIASVAEYLQTLPAPKSQP